MHSYHIEILRPAWRELEAIAEMHLSLVGPKSAAQITDKLLNALEYLKTSPYMGVACSEPMLLECGYRKLLCGEYICFYRVIGDTVYVYHIANGRQNYPKLFQTEAD